MASLLISVVLMVQAFETAQPLAQSIWEIAPAYQSNPSPLICGITYANPFGYQDLCRTTSFIRSAVNDYSVGLQWQYFGIPEYREDTVSVAMDWALTHWIGLGVELYDYTLSIHTDKVTFTQSFYDYGVYCTIKAFDKLSLFMMQNNIRNFHDDWYIPSESMLLVRADIFKGCALEYEFHQSEYIWQIFKIHGYITRYCAVDMSYSKELNLSSAGITILWGLFSIRYVVQHHSFLGNTHSFGLVYSHTGLMFASVDKPEKKQISKLDIQTCTAEELVKLDVVPEVLCQRIIKYREMFGNITIPSLYQLGFTTQQIRDLQQYTYNYDDKASSVRNDKEKSTRNHNTYISHEEKNRKVKILFQSMVAAEIPAYIAISLAEEYQKNGEKGILQSHLFKSLSSYQQKVVKTACGMQ
ncbi:MAG: ComEA family DNA-binding protein [Spirochaetota bacterium]